MINVVFLLLIFFMISSELVPAPPFDVRPPETAGEDDAATRANDTLYLSAEGEIAWGAFRGDEALDALTGRDADVPLDLRADGAVAATEVAVLLRRLAEIGISDVTLATRVAAP
jgi:biopolymer transport protein ExbD